MGGKHDKHNKIRGKERKGKKVEDVKSTPTRNSRDKRQCGCPVPEPILCSIGTLPDSEDDGVAMKCSYIDCPFAGQRVHLACFRSFENHLVKIMNKLDSARGWTDSQRRANLWEKKGRSIIAEYCDCRCGHGKTGRDEKVFYEQVQKQRHDEEAATAGQKKKVGKSKVLPKLNFGIVKSSVMAYLEPRLPKRSTGRRRDLSTSSLSSNSHTYALELDSSFIPAAKEFEYYEQKESVQCANEDVVSRGIQVTRHFVESCGICDEQEFVSSNIKVDQETSFSSKILPNTTCSIETTESNHGWRLLSLMAGQDSCSVSLLKFLMEHPQFKHLWNTTIPSCDIPRIESFLTSGLNLFVKKHQLNNNRVILALITSSHIFMANIGNCFAVVRGKTEMLFETTRVNSLVRRTMVNIVSRGASFNSCKVNGKLIVSRNLASQKTSYLSKSRFPTSVSTLVADVVTYRRTESDKYFAMITADSEMLSWPTCDDTSTVMANEIVEDSFATKKQETSSVVVYFPSSLTQKTVEEKKKWWTAVTDSTVYHSDKTSAFLDKPRTAKHTASGEQTALTSSSSTAGEPAVVAPLPIVTASTTPVLRTWRITSQGLVEVSANGMRAFLDKTRTAKNNASGKQNDLRYALASMQGWRVNMENAHVIEYSMADRGPFKDWSFFAVFDGHGGHVAATLGSTHIMNTIINTEDFKTMTEKLGANDGQLTDELLELLKSGITNGFLQLDEEIRVILNKSRDRSGSTAVCAIINPSHVVVANLGDSRAVLSRGADDVFGTDDHKPYLEREKDRIVKAGGSVMDKRINESLAISRALGDCDYKSSTELRPQEQLVSPEPDLYVLPRNTDKDEFLLLACDGIYDVMSNEEVCHFVRDRLAVVPDLEAVCNDVLDACLTKGSKDNMTVILICFKNAPKLNPEAQKREETWVNEIRKAVKAVIDEEMTKPNWEPEDEMRCEAVLSMVHARGVTDLGHEHIKMRIIDEMDEVQFLSCQERFITNDDGFFTLTSTEQKRIEETVSEEFQKFEGKKLELNRSKHIMYILKSLNELKKSYSTLDASRTWLCFWGVHSLNLLNAEIPADLQSRLIAFLKSCEHPEGGYGGGPGQLGHLAPTYAAVMTLASLKSKEALSSIDLEKLASYLKRMKQFNGSFTMHVGGECDIRGVYCALSVAALTGLLTDELKDSAAEWIVTCQTYEGGFGGEAGVEAHGGYAYCAIASLAILDRFRLIDAEGFLKWLTARQMKYEGGFQGRTNKLVDGCYSFWQAASFPLFDKEMELENKMLTDGLFNSRMLEEYIICACQDPRGGLRDKPDKSSDLYHTCYVLSGLAIAQSYSSRSQHGLVGGSINRVESINPVFNITSPCEQFAQAFFK